MVVSIDQTRLQAWVDQARLLLHASAAADTVRWDAPTTEHLLLVEAELLYANRSDLSTEDAALEIVTMVRIWWATEGRKLKL